jgi:hypothetical protein
MILDPSTVAKTTLLAICAAGDGSRRWNSWRISLSFSFTLALLLHSIEPGGAKLRAEVPQTPWYKSFALKNPLPLDKFAGEFPAYIWLRDPTQDFILAGNIDRVGSAVPCVANVKLAARQCPGAPKEGAERGHGVTLDKSAGPVAVEDNS